MPLQCIYCVQYDCSKLGTLSLTLNTQIFKRILAAVRERYKLNSFKLHILILGQLLYNCAAKQYHCSPNKEEILKKSKKCSKLGDLTLVIFFITTWINNQ